MSWRETLTRVQFGDGRQLIGASFRGVPFFVDAADRAGGRRTVVHEFPLRDDPFVEDLGRRARAFHVDGYVVGADYVQLRDALLAALEDTAGPGELVHPYYGRKRAICSGLAVRESIADGGMAVFSIEFHETPAQTPVPVEQADLPAQVVASADAAVAATEAEFVATYDADGLPGFALESAAAALASATEALSTALAPVVRSTQELAALASQVRSLTSDATSLVRQPAAVLGAFLGALAELPETVAAFPGAIVDALISTYAVDLGVAVPDNTTTRARERANQVAFHAALRRLLAIEAARLLPGVDYPSVEEATAARDAVAALLEEQALTAGDESYPALVQLRADIMRAVPGDVFARLLTIWRPVALPSLLVSYQLYGAVEQEPDILARNAIRHPGFVAGSLRVLSDG